MKLCQEEKMAGKTWKKTDRYLYLVNRYDELYAKLNQHPFVKHTKLFQILCIPFGIFSYYFTKEYLSTHTLTWNYLTGLTVFSGVFVLFVGLLIWDSYKKARALDRLGQELLFFASSLLDSEQNPQVLIEDYSGTTVNFEGVEVPEVVLIRDDAKPEFIAPIIQLAKEKGVPVKKYPLKKYNACGIIKDVSDL